MPRTPLTVLKRVAATDNYYAASVTFGVVRRGNRVVALEGGAFLPVGGTEFEVRAGVVVEGDFIQFGGQTFQVDGVEPVEGPLFRKVRVTTSQTNTEPLVLQRLVDGRGNRLADETGGHLLGI